MSRVGSRDSLLIEFGAPQGSTGLNLVAVAIARLEDEEAARAEDAAIERAERRREDMMFDRDSWEEW